MKSSSSVEHFLQVAEHAPHLKTWLSLLGDTFAAMQATAVPTLEEILQFNTLRHSWLIDPPNANIGSYEDSEEFKIFAQEQQYQYQRYQWSLRFPWDWKKGMPTPVCWNENGLLYTSYFTQRPILSILKERLPLAPKKLPFATYPYWTIAHTEIARYELVAYKTSPWIIRIRDQKRTYSYCHWKYAKEHPEERTKIC